MLITLEDLLRMAANVDRSVSFRPTVLQLAEATFPIEVLIDEVRDVSTPQSTQSNFLLGAEHVHRELLVVARFLAYGQWFSVVALLRRLLESVTMEEEARPYEAQWVTDGRQEADWSHPLTPAFDAQRAARQGGRLADIVGSWQQLSEALHGRGPVIALWTQEEESPQWANALRLVEAGMAPVTRAGMTYASRALAAGDRHATLLAHVAARGQGFTPVFRFQPEHLLAATEVLRWDEDTRELARQKEQLAAVKAQLLRGVRAGRADAAGTVDILLLLLLSHGAYRAERFLDGLEAERGQGRTPLSTTPP